jgi:hypothetical protein
MMERAVFIPHVSAIEYDRCLVPGGSHDFYRVVTKSNLKTELAVLLNWQVEKFILHD